MFRDIPEGFLRDPVERQRGSRRQRRPAGVRRARDVDAAGIAELHAIGRQRPSEPPFLQHSGMQLVREVTDVPSDLDEFVLRACDLRPCGGARWNLIFDRSQIVGHDAELLEDAVVQLSGDAGALFLLGVDQQPLTPLEDPDAADRLEQG